MKKKSELTYGELIGGLYVLLFATTTIIAFAYDSGIGLISSILFWAFVMLVIEYFDKHNEKFRSFIQKKVFYEK